MDWSPSEPLSPRAETGTKNSASHGKGSSHVKCDSQWQACLGPEGSQRHPSPCCPAVSHIRNPVASLGKYVASVELRATTTEGSLLEGGSKAGHEGVRHTHRPTARLPSPRLTSDPMFCLLSATQVREFPLTAFPSQPQDEREILMQCWSSWFAKRDPDLEEAYGGARASGQRTPSTLPSREPERGHKSEAASHKFLFI